MRHTHHHSHQTVTTEPPSAIFRRAAALLISKGKINICGRANENRSLRFVDYTVITVIKEDIVKSSAELSANDRTNDRAPKPVLAVEVDQRREDMYGESKLTF